MWKRGSNSSTEKHKHGTVFYINGATVTLDELAQAAASIIGIGNWESEATLEWFIQDMACAMDARIGNAIYMASAQAEASQLRKEWIKLHPPNHAGFYYCHIGGEWVHVQAADLEHIVPKSREPIDTTVPGWDEKLRMACRPHNSLKGSRQDVPSATLEFAPPDEEC